MPKNSNLIPEDPVDTVNNVFCVAALADKQHETSYLDATGALPVISLEGCQYFIVAHNCATTYISADPSSNVTNTTIVDTFDECFTEFSKKGSKPRFDCTDNHLMDPLKSYMAKYYCK